MITNKGRELISKFLLGQAPSYASFISFGCGAEPGQDRQALHDRGQRTGARRHGDSRQLAGARFAGKNHQADQ